MRVPAFRSRIRLGVIGLFLASGVLHLVRPEAFAEFMPEWAPEQANRAAGVVEIVCAYGLLTRRGWAGAASAVTLLAVWPANLQFALDATAAGGIGSTKALLAWGRMPLQLPMIWAVLDPDP